MSDTYTNIDLSSKDWTDIYSVSGIAVGTRIKVEKIGKWPIHLSVSAAQPAVDSEEFEILRDGVVMTNTNGDAGAWARAYRGRGKIKVSVIDSGFGPEVKINAGSSVSSIPGGTGKGINLDAWGRQKAVLDQSLLHGVFTYNVPEDKWREWFNGVELTSFSNATSEDGELRLTSGATLNDVTVLDTFRNPRYQPNRGHLYSTSMFFPNPTALGMRDFGIFTDESGVFFRLKSDGLYACRQTSSGGVPQPVIEEKIDDNLLPSDLDLSKGNIYDIQMQWRGVGDIFFYIGKTKDQQVLVHTMYHLNLSTSLNVWNPANPIAFRCENLGDEVEIKCGCVDITTEGGEPAAGSYGSISINNDTGSVDVAGFNTPVLAVRSKKIFNTLRNTRDTLALLATAYGDQRNIVRIWCTRDETSITLNDQVWSDFRDGHLESVKYDINDDGTPLVGTPMTFDTSKAELIFSSRVDQDQSYATSALFEGRTNIYQAPGDIFIFTVHRETGGATAVGVIYEFAEEI